MLGPTGHIDTFSRDHLPPEDQQPTFLLDQFHYPDYLNVGVELTDKMVEQGFGDKIALIGNGRQRSYKELTDWTNRLAHVLIEDLGVKSGNRILIRSANNPALVACWLAAQLELLLVLVEEFELRVVVTVGVDVALAEDGLLRRLAR